MNKQNAEKEELTQERENEHKKVSKHRVHREKEEERERRHGK